MHPHLKLGHAALHGYPIKLTKADLNQHVHICGRSGTGKSTLLLNLFAQQANAGDAVILIDPHGDLAEAALDLIPPRRVRQTLYINPSDLDFPVGFNVLSDIPVNDRAARAEDILSAFKSVWKDSWGNRMHQILHACLSTLIAVPGHTLLSIPPLLLNASFRRAVVGKLTDPILVQFWRDEFPLTEKKFGMEAFSPVLNKLFQLLVSPASRAILGQSQTAFDARHLIDHNAIIICNLAKGRLGEHNAALLGSLLVSTFGAAALSRADIAAEARKDFLMIVDEFHSYATDRFATLLAEARKYKLSLVLAHQYLDQLSPEVRAAVLGTTGSLIVFRAPSQDVLILAREMSPITPEQLTDTANHSAWCRLTIGGAPREPVRVMTPPPPKVHGSTDKVIRHSRQKFATDLELVTKRFNRFWSRTLRAHGQHW